MLGKGVKWMWSEVCERAFTDVKCLRANHPILRSPNFEKPFIIASDASAYGAGAVLMQESDDGIEHPISYYSKKFNSAQRNYSVIEQELLAIILALQHFAVYVPPYGPKIKIYSVMYIHRPKI